MERSAHKAYRLGYAGNHIHLLVTAGRGRDDKALRDIWLFNLSLKKWKEVSLIYTHSVLLQFDAIRTVLRTLIEWHEHTMIFSRSHYLITILDYQERTTQL